MPPRCREVAVGEKWPIPVEETEFVESEPPTLLVSGGPDGGPPIPGGTCLVIPLFEEVADALWLQGSEGRSPQGRARRLLT